MLDLFYKYQQRKINPESIDFADINSSTLQMSFDDKLYPKQWYLVSYAEH